MVLDWEKIYAEKESPGNAHAIYRARIRGGWLVKGITHSGHGGGIGLTFVPDPEYKWKLR